MSAFEGGPSFALFGDVFESPSLFYTNAWLADHENTTDHFANGGYQPSSGAIVLLVGFLIWSYILFVVLAKKPTCDRSTRLDGKTVVITGGTDGIGKVTAIELARRGARIVLPCRNVHKGRNVAKEISAATGNHKIMVVYADFVNLETVKSCADILLKSLKKIDILINNAGIGNGVGVTCDGFPLVFGVNHLAPFLFTTQMLPLLRKAQSSRIIFVSSVAHLWGEIDFDSLQDLDDGSVTSQFRAYSRSKLANVLFAKQLYRNERNNGITTYVAHPGWTFTAIFRDFPLMLKVLVFPLFYMFLYTAEQGAQTQIHLSVAPGIEPKSGGYFVACMPARTCTNANDHKLASNLWSYSAKAVSPVLTGVKACTSI